MPYPVQSFTDITSLLNYINTQWITNGVQSITGVTGNNVVNALANFIINYGVNTNLAGISTSTGVVSLSKPITIFTVVPTSVQWPNNVQNEYYIVNSTGVNISLTLGFVYVDQYGVSLTVIPARTSIHIAKATNGTWFQVNNPIASGGGANLPPQTTHDGQSLLTNGTTAFWNSTNISLTASDFQPDGKTYLNPLLNVTNKVSVFWSDLPNFLYQSNGDWAYVSSPAGIIINNAGFNANTNPGLHVELFLKGLNG